MAEGYTFDDQTTQRILNATRYVENIARSPMRSKPKRRGGGGGSSGFWAKITERGGSGGVGNAWSYSWVKMVHNDDGQLEEDPDTTGDYSDEDGWAVEGRWRSQHVILDDIVYLQLAQGDLTNSYYVFDYQPGPRICMLPNSDVLYGRVGNSVNYYTQMTLMTVNDAGNLFAGPDIKVYLPYKGNIDNAGSSATYMQIFFGDRGWWWVAGADCGS